MARFARHTQKHTPGGGMGEPGFPQKVEFSLNRIKTSSFIVILSITQSINQ